MEYEFVHDPSSGYAKALFSYEHELIGPWLEVEVGDNSEMLAALLRAIAKIDQHEEQEITITGKEYTVTINNDDVIIQPNIHLNGEQGLPDDLQSDDLYIDQEEASTCGLDDFRQVLLSWAKFTKI